MSAIPPAVPVRRASAAAAAAVLAATAALYFVSRGRWCDAIIDGGREWLVASGLSRGKLLYRDIDYWSGGPIPIYFQAAFLRIFGPSFSSLALAGGAISVALLAVLWRALRLVCPPREAGIWTALAIPAIVFMPNSGAILIGMTYRTAALFGLASLTALVRRRRPFTGQLFLSGALLGLAGLCRTEWGLCVAAGGIAALAVSGWSQKVRAGLVFLGSGAAVFAAVVWMFVSRAGIRAVIEDGNIFLTKMSEATKRFAWHFSGIADWRSGLVEMTYSTLLWAGVVLTIGLLARRDDSRATPRRLAILLFLLAALGLLGVLASGFGRPLFSGAPAICALATLFGARLHGGRRAAALAGFGLAGLLLFHRRPFHIGDSWYVGTPLLFAFVAAAGLVTAATLAEKNRRRRSAFARGLRLALAGLVVLAFAVRLADYSGDPAVPVPGTDRMLTARPEVVSGLERLAAEARSARPAGTLVVFPEGEVVNAMTGMDNPMRFQRYLPDTVTPEREPEVLADLSRARPDAIVILERPSPEYGPSDFGVDYARSLARWIAENYEEVASSAPGRPQTRSRVERLLVRRIPPLQDGGFR